MCRAEEGFGVVDAEVFVGVPLKQGPGDLCARLANEGCSMIRMLRRDYVPLESQLNAWEFPRACLQLGITTVTVLLCDTAQAIQCPEFTSMVRTHSRFQLKVVLDSQSRWACCTIKIKSYPKIWQ